MDITGQPTVTFENDDVTRVNQRLGAKTSRAVTVRRFDITGWTVKGVIDEIDTPVSKSPPVAGFKPVVGGESWELNEENGLIIMRDDFTVLGRAIYVIPGELGKLVIPDETKRTAPPRDQPESGLGKWYQYGIYFDSGGNVGFEFVGLIHVMYSVVNQ